MRSKATRTVALLVVSLLLSAGRSSADEIRVMTSGAFTAALLDVTAEFERTTRHKIVVVTTTMGTGATSIPSRLQRREPGDVVIVAADSLDEFIKAGTVTAGSRVDLARSAIGMAVRAGAPVPDVSTVEAFTRALLDAKSIAYSASVSGVYLSTELFQRLGIADRVLPKSRRIEGERVGAVVARGDAEVGFQQVSELLPVPGITLTGPLPPGVQRVTVYAAGIASHSASPSAAKALVSFLVSPAAAPAVRKSGMQPVMAAVTPQPVAVARREVR
jgi:molybdate transport system substrate-binding protein